MFHSVDGLTQTLPTLSPSTYCDVIVLAGMLHCIDSLGAFQRHILHADDDDDNLMGAYICPISLIVLYACVNWNLRNHISMF